MPLPTCFISNVLSHCSGLLLPDVVVYWVILADIWCSAPFGGCIVENVFWWLCPGFVCNRVSFVAMTDSLVFGAAHTPCSGCHQRMHGDRTLCFYVIHCWFSPFHHPPYGGGYLLGACWCTRRIDAVIWTPSMHARWLRAALLLNSLLVQGRYWLGACWCAHCVLPQLAHISPPVAAALSLYACPLNWWGRACVDHVTTWCVTWLGRFGTKPIPSRPHLI